MFNFGNKIEGGMGNDEQEIESETVERAERALTDLFSKNPEEIKSRLLSNQSNAL